MDTISQHYTRATEDCVNCKGTGKNPLYTQQQQDNTAKQTCTCFNTLLRGLACEVCSNKQNKDNQMNLDKPFSDDISERRFLGKSIRDNPDENLNELLHKHYIPRHIAKSAVKGFAGTWCKKPCGGIVIGDTVQILVEGQNSIIDTFLSNPNLEIDGTSELLSLLLKNVIENCIA